MFYSIFRLLVSTAIRPSLHILYTMTWYCMVFCVCNKNVCACGCCGFCCCYLFSWYFGPPLSSSHSLLFLLLFSILFLLLTYSFCFVFVQFYSILAATYLCVSLSLVQRNTEPVKYVFRHCARAHIHRTLNCTLNSSIHSKVPANGSRMYVKSLQFHSTHSDTRNFYEKKK